MPGRAHPAFVPLLGVVSVVVLVAVLPASATPNPPRSASALRAANTSLEAKSRSAVLSLYSLDARLSAASARLAALRADLRRLRAERATLRQEVQIARSSELVSEQQLAARLRQLFDQGELSPLEVVFGASSLSDAMTQLDNINRVASLNDEVVQQLRSARTKYSAAARTLARQTRRVEGAVRQAAAAEASLLDTRSARTSYIQQLASQRDLNATRIAQIDAAARNAESLATQITHTAPAAVVATPVATGAPDAFAASRTLTVRITGYALPGRTATGLPVGWGVAAVDPRVIPLGTHLYVPGYGEAVAADVGSAIIGDRVDLWFPSVSQAETWGLRTVTIALH